MEAMQAFGTMTMRQAMDALDREGTVGFDLVGDAPEEGLSFDGLTYDSRAVAPGTLFVCKGAAFKPEFLFDAIDNGATAYVADREYPVDAPGLVVSDIRRAMAVLANEFFGYPSLSMPVVGFTGTKGKTTATFCLDAILAAAGERPAMITGVVVDDGRVRTVSHNTTPEAIELQRILRRAADNECDATIMEVPAMITGVVVDDGRVRTVSHNTTPEAIELQRILRRAADNECDATIMEVSSQGLKYDRTLGVRFEVAVFSNIGEDHISPIEHPTFEDYLASKLRIFSQCETAVVNLDTGHLQEVMSAAAEAPRLMTYSLSDPSATIHLTDLSHRGEGRWNLEVATPRGAYAVELPMLGRFNVSNALAAIAASEALGIDHAAMEKGLERVVVPGRMERYDAPDGSLVGIVDYAHNEMSMEAVLRCVREEFPGREVTVVFGATGERATQRRLGLGRASGRFADRIILTEDDPGRVPVAQICDAIGEGIREVGADYEVIEDRGEAVGHALAGARRPAVVVLAGKGAEDSIQRACGTVPCKTDAQLLCEGLGIAGLNAKKSK